MKSIMQDEQKCYFCGSTQWLEKHHVMGGSNRKFSEEDGLTVWLCHSCHNEPPNGVHFNPVRMELLHVEAQRAYEKTHTHEEWMRRYMRNYL